MTETAEEIPVATQSDVEIACRIATGFAGESGFNARDTAELVILTSELGTNLLRHASDGRLTIWSKLEGTSGSVFVVSRDSGPGIRDIQRSLQDGQGEAGGIGSGLGAVQRLSDAFEVSSSPSGTLIRTTKTASPTLEVSVGVAHKCHPRETVNGDRWVNFSPANGHYRIGVIDGAGHGEQAAKAARAARDEVIRCGNSSLASTFERCHAALKGTRGAVMSLIAVDLSTMSIEIGGVGNVEGRVYTGGREQQPIMQRGMLGANAPRVRPSSHSLTGHWAMALLSDGVRNRFSLTDYEQPLGSGRTASGLASAILDDWARGEDDATVLVALPGMAIRG